jgi:hypothetical protein
VGGPAYIPGKFNKNKEKFFFFVGVEWQKQLVPNSLSNVTVPTALERTGDFSQSHDGGGNPLKIVDPLNGVQFPNNVIPKERRINLTSRRSLGFYPTAERARQDPRVQLPVAGVQHLPAPRGCLSRRLQHQRQVEGTAVTSTTRMKPAWPMASGTPSTTSRSGL